MCGRCILAPLVAIVCLWPDAFAWAERPICVNALPADTVGYFRITDYRELRRKLAATQLGRLAQDPEVGPLAESAASSLLDVLSPASVATPQPNANDAKITFPVALRHSWQKPWGEISLAFVPAADRTLSWILWLDASDCLEDARTLVDLRLESGVTQGLVKHKDEYRGHGIRSLAEEIDTEGSIPYIHLALVERDGILVLSDRATTLQSVLDVWDRQRPALSADRRLLQLQTHLEQSEASSPQAEWFIDPLPFYKGWAAESFLELDPLAVPALELDAVGALVGRAWLQLERYDLLARAAMRMPRPRVGPAAMLQLRPGETGIELFVPADAATYATAHWDIDRTRQELTKLGDSAAGPGATVGALKRLGLGDWNEGGLMAQLRGRVTTATWPQPGRPLESVRLTAIQLREPLVVRDKLAQWLPQHEPVLRNGHSYLRPKSLSGSCYAMLGDQLLIVSSAQGMERAIDAWQKRTPTLAECLDVKLAQGRVMRMTNGAAAIHFIGRPEIFVRAIHADWQSLSTAKASGASRLLALILRRAASTQSSLPAVDRICRRLAPYGGYLSDSGDTVDLGFFVFRRSSEDTR